MAADAFLVCGDWLVPRKAAAPYVCLQYTPAIRFTSLAQFTGSQL